MVSNESWRNIASSHSRDGLRQECLILTRRLKATFDAGRHGESGSLKVWNGCSPKYSLGTLERLVERVTSKKTVMCLKTLFKWSRKAYEMTYLDGREYRG